jgi:hypothetical protein
MEYFTNVSSGEAMKKMTKALMALGYESFGFVKIARFLDDPIYLTYRGIALTRNGNLLSSPKYDSSYGAELTPPAFLQVAAERMLNKPEEFKLNDSYTAIITKEATQVGCQTFDNKIILALADKIKEL